jgi:hypothetical protein
MSSNDPKRTFHKDTAPRGALEQLGQHKDQEHNYRRAEEGQLTLFKVRVAITL